MPVVFRQTGLRYYFFSMKGSRLKRHTFISRVAARR
jgi:hypothetical protein